MTWQRWVLQTLSQNIWPAANIYSIAGLLLLITLEKLISFFINLTHRKVKMNIQILKVIFIMLWYYLPGHSQCSSPTRSTRLPTRSTRLFTRSTRLSTCSICLSTRSARSSISRSFYNWLVLALKTSLKILTMVPKVRNSESLTKLPGLYSCISSDTCRSRFLTKKYCILYQIWWEIDKSFESIKLCKCKLLTGISSVSDDFFKDKCH